MRLGSSECQAPGDSSVQHIIRICCISREHAAHMWAFRGWASFMVVVYCTPSQCNSPLNSLLRCAKVIQFTFEKAEPAVSAQDEVWNDILCKLQNYGQGVENGAPQNMEGGQAFLCWMCRSILFCRRSLFFFFKTWIMSTQYRCLPSRTVCTAGWQ